MVWLILYILTIPAANWAITYWGIVPIGLGLAAPAGVFFAGLAFTFRDKTQDHLGKAWTLGAIGVGALLSLAISDPFVAAASALAFLVSELADFAVYTQIRGRSWLLAVALSNTVGLAIDSALFLWLAFGSLDFLVGQIVGKVAMTLLCLPLLWIWRHRSESEPAEVMA